MKKLKTEKILAVNICASPQKEVAKLICKRLKDGKQTVIFTPNPQILLRAQRYASYKKTLNSSTLNLPDGIGIILASKIQGGGIKSRISGIDTAKMLLSIAESKGYKVFLLGAKPHVAEKAERALLKKYPALKICGTHHGYFSKSGKENEAVIREIAISDPDIIFVCFGSPQQEEWIKTNKDKLPSVSLYIGLGGSLDVFAGNVKRAPEIMQKAGLEWLYRIVKEPKRAKIFLDIPIFLFSALTK